MEQLWIIGICFFAGIGLRRFHILPENGGKSLTGYVIYVALPALVLLHVHELEFDSSLIFAALMPHAVFAVAYILFRIVGRQRNWSAHTIVCLTLTAGLGNTSFVGLPMIQAFFGAKHLGVGIVIDQVGSFLCLSTSGLLLLMLQEKQATENVAATGGAYPGTVLSAHVHGARKPSETQAHRRVSLGGGGLMLKRILAFPPFIALALALALRWIDYPESVTSVLSDIGSTLTPVAMVAVGFQLRLSTLAGKWKPLSAGLMFRLLFAPALVLLLALGIHLALAMPAEPVSRAYLLAAEANSLPETFRVTVFEAAMPPMITAGILCMEYDMDADLAGLMLGLGIPISFLTLTLWHQLLILV